MNNDLISREALKKALTSETRDIYEFVCLSRILEKIDNAPTVDIWQLRQEATENALKKAEVLYGRPQGEWIEQTEYNGDTYYDCSACGNSWTTIDGTPWNNGMNFCPNCGAKMKGGEER